ncbi:MAG TPA: glycoside hydrolase family 99-like domain-containing protein [Phycisphaerae bacterium]|nr:glycoside hydrolase family 99-like domain-containing protein [Phycisphaerae bacterium]HOJ73611.1 glycoside hydrolase family 99-like domain-containing protein [Phycisphaerae bacterium]HOM51580.1 glycoside hydrolase family 99-like domain-containing protein [Phycisphaerae bacterium]HON66389.1 glycoside hydrolase family 99-like domain-containing protein [Phycisphaerae bacterium]HOQ85770.1 glycoside hydrolase family 99-like domain-containing protein [Phycisphaerae bacterium]
MHNLKHGMGTAILVTAVCVASAKAESERVLAEWKFNAEVRWNGWSPNGLIRDAVFDADGVTFNATGSDPIITGPSFELPVATNHQWVIIDLDCPQGGLGELYYTNKSEGRYGGFEPGMRSVIRIVPGTRQSVPVYPFWASLGKIIQLRFDPPAGTGLKLRAIRIVEMAGPAPAPSWAFGGQEDSWRSLYAAEVERTPRSLKVRAAQPQAVIITPVEPFDAARRSVLELDATCPTETGVTLYWANAEQQGLYGEPVRFDKSEPKVTIDLRERPEWKGTITHLAIGFGTKGGEVLTLKSLSISENDPQRPLLRVKYFNFERGVVRPSQSAAVRLIVEHAGGPALPAGVAHATCEGDGITVATPELPVPAIGPGGRAELRVNVQLERAGATAMSVVMPNGQTLAGMLRVCEPVHDREFLTRPDGYDVPPPRPVKTDYQIGVYYFPGWSADQMSRWKHQANFPERDSLLGWYDEGRPEVADWHIKWAVENGISFFVYDWYWRDGKEVLGAGLNEGFLAARYNELMKFAVMWANHPPFHQHTHEQLLTVADYWIERYFRRSNYLLVDGKPYVSFFSAGRLIADMGSEDKVRAAFDAMREKARRAGLAGIHFAACTAGDPGALESLKRAGFDSVTAYNYVRIDTVLAQSPYRHYVLAHENIWKTMSGSGVLPYTPLLTVNWDARPWHGPRTEQKFDRQSVHFAEGLARLKAHLDATGGKMAILEAWNEWGEGSYLEPNVQFGFDDVEAVRRTFADSSPAWPDNVCPYDLGLEGKYDLRNRVSAVGRHPDVITGLDVYAYGDRIWIRPGTYWHGQRERTSQGGELIVPPVQIVEIKDLPLTLVADPVTQWRGGNRLIIHPNDRRNVLPDSFVPGSLMITDPRRPQVRFEAGRDYVLDDKWGAFSLTADSRLKPGDSVLVTYRMSTRRVDAIVLDAEGKPRLIEGPASADCPDLPVIPSGTFHLANVYHPFNAGGLKPEVIYVIGVPPKAAPPERSEALQPVLAKLRDGSPVTIVCWGDSVTACGESSTPATCYVGLLESMLKERYPSAKLRVVNAGIGGTSTPGRFPNFQKEVLDFQPDVVTLEFVNDMGIPLDAMEKMYGDILQRTREAGAVLVLITPHFVRPDWMGQRSFRVTADPRPNVAFLRRFAAEHKLPLADAARRWEELDPLGIPYEILLRNGINHPEDRGHRFFAEELVKLFE